MAGKTVRPPLRPRPLARGPASWQWITDLRRTLGGTWKTATVARGAWAIDTPGAPRTADRSPRKPSRPSPSPAPSSGSGTRRVAIEVEAADSGRRGGGALRPAQGVATSSTHAGPRRRSTKFARLAADPLRHGESPSSTGWSTPDYQWFKRHGVGIVQGGDGAPTCRFCGSLHQPPGHPGSSFEDNATPTRRFADKSAGHGGPVHPLLLRRAVPLARRRGARRSARSPLGRRHAIRATLPPRGQPRSDALERLARQVRAAPSCAPASRARLGAGARSLPSALFPVGPGGDDRRQVAGDP